jgi:hypothetical protein
MMTVGPWDLLICSPSKRARMSALPPGGNGTTIRIVLDVCAQASAPNNVTAMRTAAANVFQRRLIIPQWQPVVIARLALAVIPRMKS